ncbi:bifunctional acetate--CoA ligase family protein/GNAT family N-acetyltransferase [Ramlibacter sp.]|uniref:bifunctional acetate--CoA ligase family protein/GNAT family N-acetyltransferase n=1 Tax=Ramlibacter sp. TaxID=1917967 RepID=UPI0017D9636C|nr:bifunctional acetate--CoA ligase family protein/GNAT family N-acetyltransferase [Ramlibacter sp.]MBA2673816.1 bifunctional acetate--CoA ligase family protein/GNAT family N-acetyltransferase [Ramlibacter sp.]
MSIRNLEHLLAPRSVAVVGASDRVGSVGATVWRNMNAGRFAGAIYAVNPKHASIGGRPAFARLTDLPAVPDLAVLCTPPDTVVDLVAELGRLGTRAVIVMTAGLTPAHKKAMLDAARPHLLRVLGPNCLGLLTPHLGLNASFAHTDALAGDVAFISQSGALVTAILDWSTSRGIGFSHMVSLGERADVDFGDLLDYLASDARTRSILLYIESIEAPRKFMSAARAAARNKPVIVVKAGRAGNGMKAAASHTGALAGSDIVFDAAIRRAGMLRVDTLQDLFMATETLARFRGGGDGGLTLMTNGGGAGVMAADAAALAGLALQELDDVLVRKLDAFLPPTWSHGNPIDIIGDAPVARYTQTLQALLADGTGTVLFMHAPTAIVRSEDIARACAPIVQAAPGRVMACWLGDASVAQARRIFEEAGVPDYATPEEAVRAFGMLGTYRRNQALLLEAPSASGNSRPDTAGARAIIEAALADGREMLGELEAKAVLAAYGIPVVQSLAAAATAEAATVAARTIGYPVAIKILSPDISHKSDVGGVQLHLRDEPELRAAATAMLARVKAARPEARITGLTVQAMAIRPLAQELILGFSVDPLFGPVLLFGQGGTAVEVLADRAIALPPLNRVLARDLVSRTRVARLLAGYRDHPPADLEAVGDVLIALSQMLVELPELCELDINPLLADHAGVVALDARIRVSRSLPAGAARFAITPYPAQLEETLAWQGETILVRPIRPEDEPQHRAFVAGLQPEDLRLRFFSVRRELPRSELARLTQVDYAREMAFIAVRTVPGGADETLGVVRAVIDPDNADAEFAVIVRSDLKGRGLGRLLMRKMIGFLSSRGTGRMVGYVLRDNQPMRALARSLGFDAGVSPAGEDSVFVVLKIPGVSCLPSSTTSRPAAT